MTVSTRTEGDGRAGFKPAPTGPQLFRVDEPVAALPFGRARAPIPSTGLRTGSIFPLGRPLRNAVAPGRRPLPSPLWVPASAGTTTIWARNNRLFKGLLGGKRGSRLPSTLNTCPSRCTSRRTLAGSQPPCRAHTPAIPRHARRAGRPPRTCSSPGSRCP